MRGVVGWSVSTIAMLCVVATVRSPAGGAAAPTEVGRSVDVTVSGVSLPPGEWRQVGRDGQYFRMPLDGTPLGGETEAWVAQASLERPSAGAGNAEQRYVDGVQAFQRGQLTIAIEQFEAALAGFQSAGDRPGILKTQIALGVVNTNLGRHAEATTALEAALSLARSLGDRANEAEALNSLGLVAVNQSRYDEAEPLYRQALDLRRQVGDRAGEAVTLNNLGQLYGAQGNYDEAIALLDQALARRRQLGDLGEVSQTLNNIGAIRMYQGRYGLALTVLDEALRLAEQADNISLQGSVLGNLGVAYGAQGRYPQALEAHRRAQQLAQAAGRPSTEASAVNNLGLVYTQMGQNERALQQFEAALALVRRIGDLAGEAIILNNLASVTGDLGNPDRALTLFQSALRIQEEIGDRASAGQTHNNIGSIYDKQGRYAEAEAQYTQALALSQAVGDRYTEGRTLSNLGLVAARQGRDAEALERFRQALAIVQSTGDRVAETVILRHIADLQYRAGQWSEAANQLDAAIRLFDQIRVAELSDSERVTLFETQRSAYSRYQAVLIAQNQVEAALERSEQGRARIFAEQLSANLTAGRSPSIPPAPSIQTIRQIARQQNATLVEYSLIADELNRQQDLYIWVVSPDGAVNFRQVTLAEGDDFSATADPLTALVDQTRGAVGAGTRGLGVVATTAVRGQPETAGYRELHDRLITPIADLLPQNPSDRVVIIPQGSLFQVPFPALKRADGSDLIDHHTLVTAPSIQVLGLAQQARDRRPTHRDEVLIVGNPTMPAIWSPQQQTRQPLPTLPGAQQEASAIADLFNTQPLLGNAATERRIKQAASTARLIHFATHGLLEYGSPQDSGFRDLPGALALAPGEGEDGLLTAAEILELSLGAELVVLSACDTGLGRITGDGVVGLSRSPMTAGVPSVIVTLWAIPDAPTADLMVEFYRQLSQTQDNAQSLRQAMLKTREQYPHPRNWAAFTLVGLPDSPPR